MNLLRFDLHTFPDPVQKLRFDVRKKRRGIVKDMYNHQFENDPILSEVDLPLINELENVTEFVRALGELLDELGIPEKTKLVIDYYKKEMIVQSLIALIKEYKPLPKPRKPRAKPPPKKPNSKAMSVEILDTGEKYPDLHTSDSELTS
jgi:hypothetical protein